MVGLNDPIVEGRVVTYHVDRCPCGAPPDSLKREVVNDGYCSCCGNYDEEDVEYGDLICSACGARDPEVIREEHTRPYTVSDYYAEKMVNQLERMLLADVAFLPGREPIKFDRMLNLDGDK